MIKVPRNTLHARLHHEIMWVPPPSGKNAKEAFEQLVMLERFGALHKEDSIEKRLGLLIALFDYAEPKTTEAFRNQLRVVKEFREEYEKCL